MPEIAYTIDAASSQKLGLLVIEPWEAVKERFGYTFSKPKEKKTLLDWKKEAPLQIDSAALQFLVKKETDFQQETAGKVQDFKTTPLSCFRIKAPFVSEALELLAKTQKLLHEGKQLVADLYTHAELYYLATNEAPGQLLIEAWIKKSSKEFSLRSCKAIGNGKPCWIIQGINLFLLQTPISWKELSKFYTQDLKLEGLDKQAFLSELQEEDAPKLVFKGESEEVLSYEVLPIPLLKLEDRLGALANLWMDYGNGYEIDYQDASLYVKEGCKRNKEAERGWEKDLLETGFSKKITGNTFYYCPLPDVPKSLGFLLELGWKIRDFKGRALQLAKQTELTIEERQNKLLILGKTTYNEFEASLEDVVGAFNKREHFLELSANSVGLLPFGDEAKLFSELVDEVEVVQEGLSIKKSRFFGMQELLKKSKTRHPLSEGIEESKPSKSFQGTLRPYQQKGVDWLSFLYKNELGALLADEMGLGKTVQVLAFLSRLPRGTPHLIVMPTSLLFNWKNESRGFLPEFKVLVYQGPKRESLLEKLEEYDIILTSYALLRQDIHLFLPHHFQTLIIDEAQFIKNDTTKTAEAVCQLDASFRLAITGTPVENKMEELWSHFNFLIPGLLDTKQHFQNELSAGQADSRYLERIKRKISPFLLRRTKKEVLQDLPPRIDQTVLVEMDQEEKQNYETLLSQLKSGLLKKVNLEGVSKHRFEIFEAILRLRQVCCHPLLVSSLTENPLSKGAKFNLLFEELQTLVEERHKVLVYSQFTSMLNLMKQQAKERNWPFAYLDGSTKNREEVVYQFQNDPSQLLFFVSLKAGGVGLNLTAADYVYLYDPWWNSAVEEQAINRAHRIGRKESIITKRLLMAESIEERIETLKEKKGKISESLFEEGGDSVFDLSLEELNFLFDF